MNFPSVVLTRSIRALVRILNPKPHRPQQSDVPRIAFVSLIPNLGDTIMLLPLIDEVLQNHPDAEIYCVCNQSVLPLLQLHNGVKHILPVKLRVVPGSRFRVVRVIGRIIQMAFGVRTQIASLRPDICIVPRGGIDPYMSAILAYWSGAPCRVGYSEQIEPEKSRYGWGGDRLLTRIVDTPAVVSEVDRGMALLCAANLIKSENVQSPLSFKIKSLISMASSAKSSSKDVILLEAFKGRPYVVISPGGSMNYRQWPPERFAEVASCIEGTYGLGVLLIGAIGEEGLCQFIAKLTGQKAFSLAGKTSLTDLLTVLNDATLFLGNDSGPAHLAAGLGVPTIIISAFAASGPPGHHNSPWRSCPCGPYVRIIQPEKPIPPCEVECRASTPHCIKSVEVATVISTVDAIVAGKELGYHGTVSC